MEGIPEYVNVLEDAQKCSNRAGNPIIEDTLLLIATNAMLLTERFPQADERWEDIPKKDLFWMAWKMLYKAVDRKANVKKQVVGGQDQFGAAHSTLRKVPEPDQANGPTRLATDLDEYFDALTAATTTENIVLEE